MSLRTLLIDLAILAGVLAVIWVVSDVMRPRLGHLRECHMVQVPHHGHGIQVCE